MQLFYLSFEFKNYECLNVLVFKKEVDLYWDDYEFRDFRNLENINIMDICFFFI